MSKHLIAILAIVIGAAAFAASPAATQEWVRNFIATNGASSMSATSYSNGVMRTTAVDGNKSVTIDIEDTSVYALRATNATAATVATGITNGFTFVWRPELATPSNGVYKTAGKVIKALRPCYEYGGVASTNAANLCWFGDAFAVYGVKLQPSVAAQFKENE